MAIPPNVGGTAVRHNYYDPEDFFSSNPETGEIRRRDGQRIVAISEKVFEKELAVVR